MRIIVIAIIFLSNVSFGAEKKSAPIFCEYHLIDTSRQELYTHDPAHPFRELMMHMWVPYDKQKKHYPLILFSHGLGNTYNGMTYTYLCQTIASQGYIVASVSHPYACKDIQFPDGRIAAYSFFNIVHHEKDKNLFDKKVEIWVADMLFALDECLRLNQSEHEPLYNTIDCSKIGIVGHSLGGSTALQVCRRDNRVNVAVNLDGPLYGEYATEIFDKPVLCIVGSSVLSYQITSLGKVPMHPALIWRQYFNQTWLPPLSTFIDSLPNGYKIVIDGIVHDTFSDYAFISDPIIQPWLVDGCTAHCAIVGYICEFLDKYL